MKHRFILLFLLFLLISGCAQRSDSSQPYEGPCVYYVSSADTETIASVPYSGELNADSLLAALAETPSNSKLRTLLNNETFVVSHYFNDSEIIVNLAKSSLGLNEYDTALLRCCITLTLCQLNEVEYVSFAMGNIIQERFLTPASFLTTSNEINSYERIITLYFADNSGSYLVSENRTLTIGAKNLAFYVAEELLKGPVNSDLYSPIPKNTRLLSVSISDHICFINFSSEFTESNPSTPAAARLTLYSVANSLCSLNGIDSVSFLVNGTPLEYYGYFSLKDPLVFDNTLVYSPDAQLISLYFLSRTKSELLPANLFIPKNNYDSKEDLIIHALISTPAPAGYIKAVPENLNFLYCETVGSCCRLYFDEGFINAFEDDESMQIALSSFKASLSLLDAINSIEVYSGELLISEIK